MSRRNRRLLAALVLGLLATGASSQAGLATVNDSLKINSSAGDATFSIDFQHSPDFFSLDSAGRQSDSFSIEIAAKPGGTDPLAFNNLTTIVRGDEIHLGNGLPIRNASPAITNSAAGGWGTTRGTVPFAVHGDVMTFTASLQTLGVSNGNFAYRVFTQHDGVQTAQSTSSSVPLPSALIGGMSMLLLGIFASAGRTMLRSGSWRMISRSV